MTVGNIVGEALTVHKIAKGRERREIVKELLDRWGFHQHILIVIRTSSAAVSGSASGSLVLLLSSAFYRV